jgi:ribonuclease III
MLHPKAALIERAQAAGFGKPIFHTERSGPEHEPVFESEVDLDGTTYGRGQGGSKRDAERRAAEAALAMLDREAHAATGVSPLDEPFDGPWPMVPEVLAVSLQVANTRVPAELRGDAALDAVQAFALRLYKGVLGDIGEVVDDEADEEEIEAA